jgi:hypothetical protein
LSSIFTSPHLIDAIILLTLLEGVVVVWWGGLAPAATLRLLAPGLCLLLALRAALAGAAWPYVPAALAAAGVAHLLDLLGRWRR